MCEKVGGTWGLDTRELRTGQIGLSRLGVCLLFPFDSIPFFLFFLFWIGETQVHCGELLPGLVVTSEAR